MVFKQKLINFFLAPSRLSKHFSWLDALSYVKYTFVGAALNELYGLNLTCTPADQARYSRIVNGETVMRERDYDYINIKGCIHI